MFTITAASSTRNVTVCGMKKTRKEFQKFGKRLTKQRRDDLDLMGQRVKDIVKDERRRAQTLVDEHQEFLEKSSRRSLKTMTTCRFLTWILNK